MTEPKPPVITEPTDTTIITASGVRYDLTHPDSWDGDINTIARGLANTCRFGGQIPGFYSVAEHSTLVADLVIDREPDRPQLHLAALLHDAHEAFYGDFVKPLKPLLGHDVLDLMDGFDDVIEERYSLPEGSLSDERVKWCDDYCLRIEAGVLWDPPPSWAIHIPRANLMVTGLDPGAAYDHFLRYFNELVDP